MAHRIVGSSAELVWVSPETIAAAGVSGWTELPIWVPPSGELAALLEVDVTAALAQGLSCRPIVATVADTWAWLQREGLSTGIILGPRARLAEGREERAATCFDAARAGKRGGVRIPDLEDALGELPAVDRALVAVVVEE